ncbi:MAG: radical SAM protein [Candidatus Freyarchaeota archaeon]
MAEKVSTLSSIEILNSTINNSLVRFLLRIMSGFCKKDGKSRIETALELYTDATDSACFTCSHIVHPIVKWAVRRGAKAFDVGEEDIKEKLSDVYWRRGLADVVRGVAKFGARRPFVPSAPFLVVWNYTWLCNLRCKHCYASAGKAHTDELSSREALDTVGKLADAGVTIIAFSGGEPLMRRDFFDTLQAAHDHGIFTAIATNGTLMTREVTKRIKDSGAGYVQISLDGAKPETHDDFRGVPGAYERTIKGIRNCVEQGVFVEVSTTGTKYSYKEIPDIIDLCERLGVDWWMLFNFVPSGRGRFIVENDLTPEEREEVLRYLWQRLKSNGKVEVLSTAPQFARVSLQMEEDAKLKAGDNEVIIPTHFYNPRLHGQLVNLSEFIGGCGAGGFYCALDPDGTITPCVFFPLKVGNIRDDDFEDMWDNPVFWELRDRDKLKGHCGRCEYRYVCGGCRARAYGYFGDYLAPDPGCINNLDLWEKLKR